MNEQFMHYSLFFDMLASEPPTSDWNKEFGWAEF